MYIKIGARARIRIIPKMLPYKVKITASYALPLFSISCPGRTDRTESSSGAPRKMLGMKSMKVWVMAMATIKTTKAIGEKCARKKAESAKREECH